MQKQLIIIVIFLIAIVAYKLHLSNSQSSEVIKPSDILTPEEKIPTLPITTIKPKSTINKKPSYMQLYKTETVDKIWAIPIELKLLKHAGTLSQQHDKYFNKFAIACKTTVCKLALGIEASEQTLQILTAELLFKMKQQGWMIEIAKVEEKNSDKQMSMNAIIYLFNPNK